MNPDEQNSNPTPNPDPVMGMDSTAPTPESNPMGGDMGMAQPAEPASEPVVENSAPIDLSTLVDQGVPTPEAQTMSDPVPPMESTPVDPMSEQTPNLGDASSPADTTFTPVTAGQDTPTPEATPATPETTTPPIADPSTAPANSVDPANPVAPVAGAPAKKFQLNKTTIILIAVAGVAIIGVIVTLIISNIAK